MAVLYLVLQTISTAGDGAHTLNDAGKSDQPLASKDIEKLPLFVPPLEHLLCSSHLTF